MTKKDRVRVVLAALGLLVVGGLGWWGLGQATVLLLPVVELGRHLGPGRPAFQRVCRAQDERVTPVGREHDQDRLPRLRAVEHVGEGDFQHGRHLILLRAKGEGLVERRDERENTEVRQYSGWGSYYLYC